MTLTRFNGDELRSFLRALDDELTFRAKVVLIGGSALALGYAVSAATNDIDTFNSAGRDIQEAAKRARRVTGLPITIEDSSIAQFPVGYEDRLVRALPGLQNLEIYVLERHDLAASKLLRGNQHDRQQLGELHGRDPLDIKTLNTRFDELLLDVVGDNERTEARWARYHFVSEVWGEIEGEDVKPNA